MLATALWKLLTACLEIIPTTDEWMDDMTVGLCQIVSLSVIGIETLNTNKHSKINYQNLIKFLNKTMEGLFQISNS